MTSKNHCSIARNRRLPELLAPAGSPEALTAAIEAGADAVYFGGMNFSNRMRAKNFSSEELCRSIELCSAYSAASYITLNTRVRDRELPEVIAYARDLYCAGATALIVADLGAALAIKEEMPDFELHASTQTSCTSAEDARVLAELGFSRMVCPRELSLSELEELVSQSPIEIEMFVHGAHCVSVSGQCLMSFVMGGRSGNRGECAQPCRLPYSKINVKDGKNLCASSGGAEGQTVNFSSYVPSHVKAGKNHKPFGKGKKQYGRSERPDRSNLSRSSSKDGNDGRIYSPLQNSSVKSADGYPLSLKDLCLAEHITEIISAGVSSLKIEGRLKSPDYVYGVTKIYRALLDEGRNAYPEELSALEAIFSRDGFTDGYFTGNYSGMDGVRQEKSSPSPKQFKNLSKKVPINAHIEIKKGSPVSLTLTDGTRKASVSAPPADIAKTVPATEELIIKSLSRLGGTPYSLDSADINVIMDPGLWMTVSQLNDLRRRAVSKLLGSCKRKLPIKKESQSDARDIALCADASEEENRAAYSNSKLGLFESDSATSEAQGLLTNSSGNAESDTLMCYNEPSCHDNFPSHASISNALPYPQSPIALDLKPGIPVKTAEFRYLRQVPESAYNYFDIIFIPAGELLSSNSDSSRSFDRLSSDFAGKIGIALPAFSVSDPMIHHYCSCFKRMGGKYALVNTASELTTAVQERLVPIASLRFNITNSTSAQAITALGARYYTISPELPTPAMKNFPCGSGAIVYGRLPLMLLRRCITCDSSHACKSDYIDSGMVQEIIDSAVSEMPATDSVFKYDIKYRRMSCSRSFCSSGSNGEWTGTALIDRKGAQLPVIAEAGCMNIIVNPNPIWTSDVKKQTESLGLSLHHYIFTIESSSEAERVVIAYKNGFSAPDSLSKGTAIRRM